MRSMQFIIGIILVVKGIGDCFALPAAISALHVGSAYSAGEATGLVVGTLAVLAGGVMLALHTWRARKPMVAADTPAT